jgi:hypothetical protein
MDIASILWNSRKRERHKRLNKLSVMNSILEENNPLHVEYTIATEKRTNLYFLADGICPQCRFLRLPTRFLEL